MRNVARGLRLIGRALLAMGAIFVIGSSILAVNAIVEDGVEIVVVAPNTPQIEEGDFDYSVRTSNLVWLLLLMTAFVVGLVAAVKGLNRSMRAIIGKIAGFVRMPIFATELLLGALVWSLSIIILLFHLPVGAVLAGIFLATTEICFLLAWLFYGRKKYTL